MSKRADFTTSIYRDNKIKIEYSSNYNYIEKFRLSSEELRNLQEEEYIKVF